MKKILSALAMSSILLICSCESSLFQETVTGSNSVDSSSEKKAEESYVVIFDENGDEVSRKSFDLKTMPDAEIARSTGTHKYVTPCMATVRHGKANAALGITTDHDNTNIYVDNKWMGRISAGNTMYISANSFLPGTQVIASNEVQCAIWNEQHRYTRGFTLLPQRKWGTDYRVPRMSPYSNDGAAYVTVVSLSTGYAQVGDTYTYLTPGSANVFKIQQGRGISSDVPIFCTAWIDAQDYCRGFTLEPFDK